MTWFKVDDSFWSHPKVLALSPDAIALWVRAGSWCGNHLTDGSVPAHILPIFAAKKRSISELVFAGMWTVSEDGYQFHDWSEYQPSRDEVLTERRRNAERQKRFRQAKRQAEDGRNAVTTPVTNGVSNDAPTRPDPTRPDQDSKESSLLGESKIKETRLPADWVPSKAHYDLARERRVDITAQADAFRLHAETHDRHAARWNAAFTSWLKKATPGKSVVDRDAWMNR